MHSMLQLFDVQTPLAFHPSKLNPIPDSLNEDYENEQVRLFAEFERIDRTPVEVDRLDEFNRAYLDRLKESKAASRSVCIDGMSAVGKSSIAFKFSNRMLKPGSGSRLISRNSHPSSCMAYVFNFIKTMVSQKGDELTLFDRLPFNTLMWNKIWLMLGRAERTGSVDPKSLFKYTNYLDSEVLESMTDLSFNIILVDSDFEGSAERLRKRAEGCDVERSHWPHYMPIQYFAYTTLHARWPHLFYLIDLQSFKGDQGAMQDYVVSLIKRIEWYDGGRPHLYKFEPIDLFKSNQQVPYILCGDVKCERLRPLVDVGFTIDAKRFMLTDGGRGAKPVRFLLVEPHGVRFSVGRKRVKGKLFASASVCDPQSMWTQLVELSDGVLVGKRVLRFKTNQRRFEFIKMLQSKIRA